MISTEPTVCVVDDDASVLRAVARLLRSARFVVHTFNSAEHFLSARGRVRTDCLVVDIHLPGLSGWALQEHLEAAGSSIPFVFITAHDDAMTRERTLKAGAASYLTKPFDDEALLDAVRSAIRDGRTGLDEPS